MNASVGVDPEVRAALEAAGWPVGVAGPEPSLELLAEMRAAPPPFPVDETQSPDVRRDELAVAGVLIRVFRRQQPAAAAVPGIAWFHGGGTILGSHDLDAAFLDGLVATTGCVAVSVEYRLAPETPYPGPVEDCYAGLAYLHAHAAELGVDPARLAVGGGSAGGLLAAACALLARERGIPLVHQHLLYPMLDDRQTTPSSQWELLPVWSTEMNAFGWRCYLGDLYGGAVPAAAAPARAVDLAGLPPAYIHVGGLDGFLHEDLDYAARLAATGVPVELHVFPHQPHGFDVVAPQAPVSKTANALSQAALARVLSV